MRRHDDFEHALWACSSSDTYQWVRRSITHPRLFELIEARPVPDAGTPEAARVVRGTVEIAEGDVTVTEAVREARWLFGRMAAHEMSECRTCGDAHEASSLIADAVAGWDQNAEGLDSKDDVLRRHPALTPDHFEKGRIL